jgi:hypothetical protein
MPSASVCQPRVALVVRAGYTEYIPAALDFGHEISTALHFVVVPPIAARSDLTEPAAKDVRWQKTVLAPAV